MSNENWVQLEVADDWGYRFLRVQDKSIEHRMSRRQEAVEFKSKMARILWPNGLIQNVTVTSRSGTSQVQDHSNRYSVKWTLSELIGVLNGVAVPIPIEGVLVHKDSIQPIRYRTDEGPTLFCDPNDFSVREV